MLDYLINYGIETNKQKYSDLDINDRMALENQINGVRKNYFDLLNLMDQVQAKILDVNRKISQRVKEITSESNGNRINSILSADDIYIALEAERDALKSGMNMISSQLDFYKSDLRMLNSVFYNKF